MILCECTLNMMAHGVCDSYSRSLCDHRDRCVLTYLEYTAKPH